MQKKFWIRALALAIAVFMTACLAVGCGGGSGDTSSNGSQTAQTGSDQANVTSDEEDIIGGDEYEPGDESGEEPGGEDEPGEVDSGTGNTGTASGSNAGTTTSKQSGGSQSGSSGSSPKNMNGRIFTVALYSENDKAMFTDKAEGVYADSIREVAKKYNCKFKIVTMPTLELLTTVEQDAMSGKATWDAVQVDGYNAVPYSAKSGHYICLSDYYNFDDGVWDNASVKDLGMFEGKRYALPLGCCPAYGIYYNLNLVKAANLPDPWTYVDNNTWNWDTFKTFTKALTVDTDGDGTPNQFGFATEPHTAFMVFTLANGGKVVDLSSGHGKLGIDTPNAKEALNYVISLYNEQITPNADQYADQGLGGSFESMLTGKVATYFYHQGYGPYLANKTGMDWDDIGWVYVPKGPRAKDYVNPQLTSQSMLMIQRYAKDPADTVLAIQDFMAYWSPSHKSKMTVKQMREKSATQDIFVDFLTGRRLEVWSTGGERNVNVNILAYGDALSLFQEMCYETITTKKYTVQAGIDAYKGAMQAAVTAQEEAETY